MKRGGIRTREALRHTFDRAPFSAWIPASKSQTPVSSRPIASLQLSVAPPIQSASSTPAASSAGFAPCGWQVRCRVHGPWVRRGRASGPLARARSRTLGNPSTTGIQSPSSEIIGDGYPLNFESRCLVPPAMASYITDLRHNIATGLRPGVQSLSAK